MKVLANRFAGTYQKEILLGVIKETGITYCYNVIPETFKITDAEAAAVNCRVEHLFASEVHAARYSSIDFSKLIPLDENLLKKLSFYECEVMRMMEKEIPSHTYFDKDLYPAEVIEPHLQFRVNKFMLGSVTTPDYEERHRMYYRHVRFWNDFFSRNPIDFLLMSYYPHYIYEYIAYRVAEVYGIPAVIASYTRINQHCQVYNSIEENNAFIKERFEEVKRAIDPADVKLNKYFQFEWDRMAAEEGKQTLPWYFNEAERKEIEERAKGYYAERQIAEQSRKISSMRYQKKNFRWLVQAIRRRFDVDFLYYKFRIGNSAKYAAQFQQYYETLCEQPDYTKNYIYVPLHMQPEATTSPVGGVYANQSLMIQMLSYYLPEGWYLYVKENPWQKNKHRSVSFYQDLKALPNVKLISKLVDTFTLQKHSRATATITGSAGLEGLFKNKPCLSFGYHYYMHAPGVFNIRSNKNCENAMDKLEKGVQIDRGELLLFFQALQDTTIEGSLSFENLVQAHYSYNDNISRLIAAYVASIKLIMPVVK